MSLSMAIEYQCLEEPLGERAQWAVPSRRRIGVSSGCHGIYVVKPISFPHLDQTSCDRCPKWDHSGFSLASFQAFSDPVLSYINGPQHHPATQAHKTDFRGLVQRGAKGISMIGLAPGVDGGSARLDAGAFIPSTGSSIRPKTLSQLDTRCLPPAIRNRRHLPPLSPVIVVCLGPSLLRKYPSSEDLRTLERRFSHLPAHQSSLLTTGTTTEQLMFSTSITSVPKSGKRISMLSS